MRLWQGCFGTATSHERWLRDAADVSLTKWLRLRRPAWRANTSYFRWINMDDVIIFHAKRMLKICSLFKIQF